MSKVEFEWISDEEREWRQRRSDAAPPSWPWRRWLAAFLLLIALAAAGLYWRERALHTIEADVQRAHDLLLAGAQAGDIDLLRRMIVQSDPAWTQAWLDLARGRGWLDRGSWGMTLAAAPPDLRSVTLTPDLSEAETLTQATFSAAAIAVGQPFTLTLPAVFTYTAQGRWLFAPPRPPGGASARCRRPRACVFIIRSEIRRSCGGCWPISTSPCSSAAARGGITIAATASRSPSPSPPRP